jgi:hypothetical protein
VDPGAAPSHAPRAAHPEGTQFRHAWRQYIRGNVASDNAATLITSFLTKTMARSAEFEPEEDAEADKSDVDDDIPPLRLKPGAIRKLFDASLDNPDDAAEPSKPKAPARAAPQTSAGMRLAQNLWGSPGATPTIGLDAVGPFHDGQAKQHLEARAMRDDANTDQPYSGKSNPRAELYGSASAATSEAWFAQIAQEVEPPTTEQMEFLRAVERRIQQEKADERRDETVDAGPGEPLFDLIHGVPGAGKSKLIGWLRRFFE